MSKITFPPRPIRLSISVTGIKYLLHRLGFSCKKPKYVPGKSG
ncbi:MAG: winged helix-turn-helix domain-containing protein [Planctomycetaceae bacterium]|nr:winged helix-turn-helix domain-containing protein [Planctomycetaceae bacterium]